MLGAMRYDLSAFQVDWNDPQLNTATANWGFFAVANGESAESTGRRAAAFRQCRRAA